MKSKIFITILNSVSLLSLIISCSGNSGQKTNRAEGDNTEFSIISSKVNELRLRESPNTTSKVLYALSKGEEVYYLNEKTDFTETIRMGSVDRIEPWLKIRTMDGIEGWSFGGGLKTDSEKQENSIEKKEFKDLAPKELSKKLGLAIEMDFPGYEGYYEYYTTSNGVEILHGKVSASAEKQRPEIGLEIGDVSVSYAGQFVNGTKDGKFVEELSFWESQYITTLFFEASGNRCLWGEADYGSEGFVLEYKVGNPKDCTFAAVAKEAGEKAEWTEDY